MSSVHVQTPEPEDPEPSLTPPVVGATIDHARDIGGALARLDALEAAHAITRSTAEAARDAIAYAAENARGAIERVSSVAEDLESLKLAKAADDAANAVVDQGEEVVEPVTPPAVLPNEAHKGESGWRGFFRKLNFH
jgi:hypothetical protein